MQPHVNTVSAVVLFGLILTTTLIGLIFTRNRFDHSSLLGFFGVLLIIQTESFLNRTGLSIYFPLIINVSIPLLFVAGPLLLSYVQRASGGKPISRLHFIPFALYATYFLMFLLQPGEFKISVMMRTFHPLAEVTAVKPAFDFDPLNIQGLVVVELMSIHLLTYSALSLAASVRNADAVKKHWATFLSSVMLAGSLILFLSQGGVVNGYVFLKTPFPHYLPDLWITGAMYLIVFYLLFNPGVLKSTLRYTKSSLPSDLRRVNFEKIRAVMETECLYRTQDFSVDVLAAKSGVSKHHISQILNEELKITFYEFVHRYRIEDAKMLLKRNEDLKIEQLAYTLGYKSKATFFTAFKKATSLTPAQYKQKVLQDA